MTAGPPPLFSYYGEVPKPYARQRSTSVTFGVLAIVLGSLSGCLGVVTPLALLAPTQGTQAVAPRPGTLLSAGLLYVGVAAGCGHR